MPVCSEPDCPIVTPPRTYRCPTHQRQHDRARGTRQSRGYGAGHDRERARWAPKVARGTVVCARPGCGRTISPTEPWDLGHTDDRKTWTGPEHATCNRAAGGRAAHR